MKITNPTLISTALLCAIVFSQSAFAGSVRAERESRSQYIVSLQAIIHDSRVERSKRVRAKLDLARLQAEIRKERRNRGGGHRGGSGRQQGHPIICY